MYIEPQDLMKQISKLYHRIEQLEQYEYLYKSIADREEYINKSQESLKKQKEDIQTKLDILENVDSLIYNSEQMVAMLQIHIQQIKQLQKPKE